MVQFKFTYDPSISVEQRVGFELAAMIWSKYLTDDITINFHIASSDSLGTDGQAVGGAIPLFHEQTYGIYREYAEADATSDTDAEALASQQEGNTVDFLVDGQVVDGNTNILLTSAQAQALGMDEALTLDNGGTWDRNLVDAEGLDGYILVSNSFDWNYDYTRSGDAPEGTLDFMSMALHEIGHQLGFVSSLDGTLDINTLHSGETRAEGFSVLDLFRHSIDSTAVENPDGSVSDLSLGQNSYFSTDGGETNIASFANGVDYQASHWKRMQVALGIMDPTLAYKERVSLGHLDLQAMDVLGWDVNYGALEQGLNLDALLLLAENKVEASLGLGETALDSSRGGGEHGDLYSLGYGEWWAIFEKHVLELGYGEWWSIFEMGYSEWKGQFEQNQSETQGVVGGAVGGLLGVVNSTTDVLEPVVNLELGYGEWWQAFEANVLELGYGEWWQSFETDMLKLGYGEWWQLLELGYGEWWQQLETFFFTLDKVDGNASAEKSKVADGGIAGKNAKVYRGGENDDIIAGDKKQDRINAGAGDDLVDGKEGHDVIWGEAGNDIIYGQDGNDLIYGGDDDDLLLGEADDDELHGEAGHDIASGGNGNDIVTGGAGKDDLRGDWGHDVIDGGTDSDILRGGAGSDVLIGGEGEDQLYGGDGDDVLYGDAYDGNKSLKQLRTELVALAEANGNEGGDAPSPSNPLNPVRIEAESMTLTGDAYIDTALNNDSGDSVKTTGTSTATTTFSGQSGSYMLVARYFDAAGGSGELNFSLNGTSLNSFHLDQDTNHYYTQTVFQDLTLNTGDELTITAIGDGTDEAALDYLEFIPLDNLLTSSSEQPSNLAKQTTTIAEPSSSLVGGLVDTTVSLLTLPLTLFTGTQTQPSEETKLPAQITTAASTLRVEAESMLLVGDYYTEANNSASGGSLIAVSEQGEGKALTKFAGEDGYYNVVVGYYDESGDGLAKISTSLSGKELDIWWLDQALSSEQEASNQSFKTRTVASTVFLQNGDIFELTGLRGAGNEDELARIDYVDFVTVDLENGNATEISEPLEVAPSAPVIIGEAIRIEAESMTLNSYSVESNSNASGSRLIKTNSSGAATTQFSGETGYYNITVAYYDENDGQSTVSASLGGVELDAWQLDQSLGSNYISTSNRVTRTIATQIKVNKSDELRLQGIRKDGEYARIDYVEFIPVSAPVISTPAASVTDDDFLQGGAGNDILVGGNGDDSLYGDSGNDALYGDQLENNYSLISSLKNGLVGHWEFDESSGLQAKDSTGGKTGTLTYDSSARENADWTSGKIGGALDFDGSYEKVLVADASELDLTQSLTLTTWVKADAFENGAGLITKGTSGVSYALELDSDGKLIFNANDGFYTKSTSFFGFYSKTVSKRQTFVSDSGLALNEWHHVAVTYNGKNVEFYIDGQLDSSAQASIALETSNEALMFGADLKDGTYFDGELDDARIYNRALSVDELAELSAGEKDGNDFLYGGIGSDTLEGGAGNDVLDGTDVIAAGYFETDILGGGLGADTFVLGNANQAYYLGGGDQDYALIQDFNAAEDIIQLHGSASDYTQQQEGNDTYLTYQGSTSELVAVFKNVNSLDFNVGFVFA